MTAIILFMSSSGAARTEMLSLSIQDFIDSTRLYHNSNDIYEILDILKEREDVVPTWKVHRQKTDKWYYTFCSPEANREIINYLLLREDLDNDKLDEIQELAQIWYGCHAFFDRLFRFSDLQVFPSTVFLP